MMRREIAYRLAGRRHQQEDVLAEAHCHHELRFSRNPPAQAESAMRHLQQLPRLDVQIGRQPDTLRLCYDLAHYNLRMIENLLLERGFRLDDSLMTRMRRSLTYFREDTQCRNAASPQRLIKQSNHIYVKAYEHHPHGDHDDTPLELREIK